MEKKQEIVLEEAYLAELLVDQWLSCIFLAVMECLALMNSAKVVAVSVFYNRADCVESSVISLLSQTYENLDIILVDDGSSDGTHQELLKYAEHPRVTVISQKNKGFTLSMLEAIDSSDSEFIAVHGSGDESYPTRISEQVEYLNANKEVGAVGCWRCSINLLTGSVGLQKRDSYLPVRSLVKGGRNPFSHGEVTMRRSAYISAGKYRPFFTYVQDYDLWLRMNESFALGVLPKVLYKEYGRLGGLRNDPSKAIHRKKLARLAYLAAIERGAGRQDPIDQYGDDVFFLLEGDKRLAKRFVKSAWIAGIKYGSNAAVEHINEAEKLSPSIVAKFSRRILSMDYGVKSLRFLARSLILFRKTFKSNLFKG